MRSSDARTLNLFLPRLPDLKYELAADSWIEELLQVNCGETLVSNGEGHSERRILDSCSISREGFSYRLQIKKSCVFADGQEMTAEDIMDSLLRVANQPFHPSGLGRILRSTGPDLTKSFRVLSRYRLEVLLNRAIPDFLERLSHPSCFLHKKGSPQLTSGSWFIAETTEEEILLLFNPQCITDNKQRYNQVRIRKLDAALWQSDDFDQAFVALFPGDMCPTPAGNILNGRSTAISKLSMLRALWLTPEANHHPDPGFSLAITDYARQRSLWRKKPLRTLFENQSFRQELPLVDSMAKPSAGSFNFHCLPPEPAAAFLDDLRAFVHSRWAWDLQHQTSKAPDAYLFSLYEGSPHEAENTLSITWNCLEQMHQRMHLPPLSSLKKLSQEDEDFRRQKLIREQLQKLSHNPALIPLYRTPILIHSNRNLHRDPDQAPLLLFSQVGDSLRREQTDELRQASLSALGSAVQMLVHDVKRPFAMLQGVLTLMASHEDPERIRELAKSWLPEVKKMTHTVQEMISDVLEMASNQDLITEPLSLLDVLHDALNLLTPASKNLHLQFKPRHTLMLEGDRFRLSRVLGNLLNNAIQATPDSGCITISSTEENAGTKRWLRVRVNNTGSFIAAEKRQRIFEAFFTEGKRQGTGLGLTIAQKIIVSHGGQIHCESTEEAGTSFIFTIPASYRQDPRNAQEDQDLSSTLQRIPNTIPSTSPSLAPGRASLHLLLVDDDQLYTSFMRDVWQSLPSMGRDLQLSIAEDARGALELLQTQNFDLILVDYELGKDDGLELIPQLRLKLPGAIIALHSHHSSIELREDALKAGADAFEPKPLTSQLAQQLIQLIKKPNVCQDQLLILVEDDPLYQDMWLELCPQLKCFAYPEQLLAAARTDRQLLEKAKAVITDRLFVGTEMQGQQLAELIHRMQPDLPIYLCSQIMDRQSEAGIFKGFVAKDPESIQEFLQLLSTSGPG